MSPAERHSPQFHFALPRLFAQLSGGNARAADTSWSEANLVGGAVMLLSYLALRRCIFGGAQSVGHDLLFTIPLALGTWVFWLFALYLNALIIRLFRAIGLFATVSNTRAQSVLVLIITTAFALQLTGGPGWPRTLAWLWIATVIANLLAAVSLAFISRTRDGK